MFINPITGDVWQEGDIYKRESFGRTLQKIAQNGADEFYVVETAENLIADVSNGGGIITLEDLRSYRLVTWALYYKTNCLSSFSFQGFTWRVCQYNFGTLHITLFSTPWQWCHIGLHTQHFEALSDFSR